MFTEYHVNVVNVGGLRHVEAFADGESLGRCVSDERTPYKAAVAYLEPFGLAVDTYTSPVRLTDVNGVQYRAFDPDWMA